MRSSLAVFGYVVSLLVAYGVMDLFDTRVLHSKFDTTDAVIISTVILLRAIVEGREKP